MKLIDRVIAGPARDYIGYGRTVPRVIWPNEARIAVNFIINYEGVLEKTRARCALCMHQDSAEDTEALNRTDSRADRAACLIACVQPLLNALARQGRCMGSSENRTVA